VAWKSPQFRTGSGCRAAAIAVFAAVVLAACGAAQRDQGGAPPASRPGVAANAAAAGTPPRPGDDGRRAEVRIPDGTRFVAEIADTPERWQRGYMNRPEVGQNEAMIFVFPYPEIHLFWMKNTLVPLDILWLDERLSIVHLETQVPPCRKDPCPNYGPARKVRFVLELRGSTAARHGLKTGDSIAIAFPEPMD